MDLLIEFLPLVLAGVVAGFLAGLLGIGGGIVTIPVLFIVFDDYDIPFAWRMHTAIATSLAIIIATNCSSVMAHHRKGAVDWHIAKDWSLFIVGGAVLGSYFATMLKTTELVYIFASLAALLALKMLLPFDKWKLGENLPSGVFRFSNPAFIGFFSAVMGIGGGSFSVPYMTLFGVSMHRAVGTASFIGLILSIAAVTGYIILGQSVEGMPDGTIGFIHLPSGIIVALGAVLTAPFGAKVAHKLPQKALSVVFGVFLIAATLRLINAV